MHLFQSTLSPQTLQVHSLIMLDIKQDKRIVKESRDEVKCITELTAFSCDSLNFLSTVFFFQPRYHKVTSIEIFTM